MNLSPITREITEEQVYYPIDPSDEKSPCISLATGKQVQRKKVPEDAFFVPVTEVIDDDGKKLTGAEAILWNIAQLKKEKSA